MFQFSLKCSYGGFDYKGKCICCINSYVIRFKWQKRISVTCSEVEKVILLYRGFRPKPWLTFCLDTKSKQKSQDYACFTRKTYAQLAETVQTRSFVAQTGQFQTPTSLVFRFTRRGQSLRNCVQFNILYIFKENIYQMHYICC